MLVYLQAIQKLIDDAEEHPGLDEEYSYIDGLHAAYRVVSDAETTLQEQIIHAYGEYGVPLT